MQTTEQPYELYLDSRLEDLETVCTLGAWQIESASEDGDWLLVMVNHEARSVVRCCYGSVFERADDIALLHRLPPDRDADAGVFAWLTPLPPSLRGSAARPFPPTDESPAAL